MTATRATGARAPATPGTPAGPLLSSAVKRTLFALLASALGAVPLCTLLSDRGWLLDVWLSMLVTMLPALLLRLNRPASALQIWPGIVLLVPWLTGRFLSGTAWHGVIPSGRTWQQVSALLDQLHDTTQHQVAPVHSTVAIRLAACAMLGLLAALVDLIAVVGRHGALAGVPLLVVYTVAGSVPHRSVGWWLFLWPAVGFLILLALDARDDRVSWGHRVLRPGHAFGQPASALGGQRIAVFALVVAVLLPFATPSGGTNLISLFTRHSHGTGGSGGNLGSIDPFAALRGQLTRGTPQNLAAVTVSADGSVTPFYLRENVLSVFTGAGWKPAANHGPTHPTTVFDTAPSSGTGPSKRFTAQIDVLGLSDNPPVFADPTAVRNLDGTTWSVEDQLLLGASVHSGQSYVETVAQPEPSTAQLRAAPDDHQDPAVAPWLGLPNIPKQVRTLTAHLIRNANGPYARALAIDNYFTDPDNGFLYSLQTAPGDSGNDLVDFLTNKIGYCQQYAAAMAVMLRLAHVPARVVLGYTHPSPDANGSFTITTNDAHAWVEAYFAGIGWIPFDPTPITGDPGASTTTLPWAPRGGSSGAAGPAASASQSSAAPVHRPAQPSTVAAPAGQAQAGGTGGVPGWLAAVLVVLVIVLVLLLPFFVRVRRRLGRLRAGHRGDPDPLWDELSDTAVDLGYVWSPTRTPRQVVGWLGDAAGDARGSLATLAGAVEAHRYAPPGSAGPAADLRHELASVTARLRAGRDRSTRLRAVVLPASLGWVRRRGAGRRR